MVPELPSPPQRARPFHSHSIQTQASPFHLSRSVLRAITLVFWVGHLFQPFFIIVWCMDCLFCRIPGPIQSFRHWHRKPSRFTATGFLIHSSCPIAMDSWKFIIEVHWTWSELHWSELHWSLFDIGRVFFWKERGIGRFSWALQDPARNHPPCMEPHGIPVVHTCLFPTFVGTGLSWLYFGWKLLVDDGL